MATIYRFIVENKATKGSGSGSGGSKKGAGKKGKDTFTLLNSMKGGVESNRKMRAINPVLNKITGGWWEKGTRLGRAGLGLIKFSKKTGAIAGVSFVAIAIIISFALQEVMKYMKKQQEFNNKINANNFTMLENGVGAIHGEFAITRNAWNGRVSYNQNK